MDNNTKNILIFAFVIAVISLGVYAVIQSNKKNAARETGSGSADIIKNLMGN